MVKFTISSLSHTPGAIVATSLRVTESSPCHAKKPLAICSLPGPRPSADVTKVSVSGFSGAVSAASISAVSSVSDTSSVSATSALGRRFSSASALSAISSIMRVTSSSRAANTGSEARAALAAAASTMTPRVCNGLNPVAWCGGSTLFREPSVAPSGVASFASGVSFPNGDGAVSEFLLAATLARYSRSCVSSERISATD
mmetsp:Transcript_2232/g.7766  ORF Transcript_2232/g.7766 Transcript_2232/m.7766 type:complete len:200 (+) Transcript_2232:629-1228(+)